MEPETRYARSGEVSIAYQVTGDGPFDVVYVTPMASHVEPRLDGAGPSPAYFGTSPRSAADPLRQARHRDVRSRERRAEPGDAHGRRSGGDGRGRLGVRRLDRTVRGAPMCILFAATYPSRTWALVLEGSFARARWAHDYPWGRRDEEQARVVGETERLWGTPEYMEQYVRGAAPSADDENRRALMTMLRQSASPGSAAALSRMNWEIDVRHVLSAVRVPARPEPLGGVSVYRQRSPLPGREHSGSEARRAAGADHALFAAQPELTRCDRSSSEKRGTIARSTTSRPRARNDPLHGHRRFRLSGRSSSATRAGARSSKPTTRSFAGGSAVSGARARHGGRRVRRIRRTGARDPLRLRDRRRSPRSRSRDTRRPSRGRVRDRRRQDGRHRSPHRGSGRLERRRRRGRGLEHGEGSRRRPGSRSGA